MAAGAAALRRDRSRPPIETVVGWSAIAAGLGSVAFHGPGGPVSRITHDSGLIALLGSIGLADLERRSGRTISRPVAALVPIISVAVATSRWNEAAQVVAGAIAIVGEASRLKSEGRSDRIEDLAVAPTAIVGGMTHVLGRTGGPLCSPGSRFQPHALWHAATAATVWMRARSIDGSRAPLGGPEMV